MKNEKINRGLFGAAIVLSAVALAACGDDTETGSGGNDGGTTVATGATTGGSTTSGMGGDDATSASTGGDGGSGGGGGGAFVFATDAYDAYEQIDRHAAPEAGTAGIAGEQGLGFAAGADIEIRDAYNMSNPAEDATGMWVPEISESVTIFHQVLDDDLTALGLVPATVEESLAQAGPVIVPDTIKYDPSQPTAYPNGRTLEDQVVDITLAAVLLNLGAPGQPLTLFADLPLNPPENDVPFEDEFPYLAPPHPAD